MKQVERQLLERILTSRHFKDAQSLKGILKYICTETTVPGAHPLKEYEIALNILGREDSFDPKNDPIVRVNIAAIREKLSRFFETEGRNEELRLVIPKGQYRALFFEAGTFSDFSRSEEVRSPALERFWSPYLMGDVNNLMLFSELLFLRNNEGTFLRNTYANDPNTVHQELKERFPAIELDNFVPSYHFISSGEMQCMYHLNSMFSHLGVGIRPTNTRFVNWSDLGDSNLILVGSARTNHFLDSMQGKAEFILQVDSIENRNPLPGETPTYKGFRNRDGKLERVTEYVIITRRACLKPGCVATLIASNHSRAIEAAGRFITNESNVRMLLNNLSDDEEDGIRKECFQILLRVEMIDYYEEVIKTEFLTHRILDRESRPDLDL